jgi:hypothetical protein
LFVQFAKKVTKNASQTVSDTTRKLTQTFHIVTISKTPGLLIALFYSAKEDLLNTNPHERARQSGAGAEESKFFGSGPVPRGISVSIQGGTC